MLAPFLAYNALLSHEGKFPSIIKTYRKLNVRKIKLFFTVPVTQVIITITIKMALYNLKKVNSFDNWTSHGSKHLEAEDSQFTRVNLNLYSN